MRDFLVQSAVAGVSGGVILILAALGIYGVVGLMVATRTREIAVRIALGASRRRVLSMILLDVVKLVMPGVAVGLVITVALIRLNGEKMGIPLSNVEPLAYAVGAAIAVLIAVLASLVPERLAARRQVKPPCSAVSRVVGPGHQMPGLEPVDRGGHRPAGEIDPAGQLADRLRALVQQRFENGEVREAHVERLDAARRMTRE